jgi:hypothetical protein
MNHANAMFKIRFNLRGLFYALSIIAIMLALFALGRAYRQDQRSIVEEMESLGGKVGYDFAYPDSYRSPESELNGAERLLRDVFGHQYFSRVTSVLYFGDETYPRRSLKEFLSIATLGARLPDVTTVSLARIPIAVEVCTALAKFVHLKDLRLYSKVDATAWPEIARMAELDTLHLGGLAFDESGLRVIADGSKLRKLRIENPLNCPARSLASLRGASKLSVLELHSIPWSMDHALELSRLDSLDSLAFQDVEVTVADLELILESNHLSSLSILYCSLDCQSLKELQRRHTRTHITCVGDTTE